jgi:hypothetical protein
MSKKITVETAMPFFHSILHRFLTEEEIDPFELDQDEMEWLMYIANYFFLQGMVFAANVGGVEIERHIGSVH